MPVPIRLIVCGLPLASSVMLTLATRLPLAVGVKVTTILQLAAARTVPLVGQVVEAVKVKSLLLAPVMARAVIFKVALPVLVSITVCAALVVLTSWLLKVRLGADRLTMGPGVTRNP